MALSPGVGRSLDYARRMGFLADFYAASDDTTAVTYQEQPDRFELVVQTRRISDVELASLFVLLRGETDPPAPFLGTTILVVDHGEQFITRLPSDFVALLAAASDDRLGEVAVGWSQTDEIRMTPSALVDLLRPLRRLCTACLDKDLQLYLWNSI